MDIARFNRRFSVVRSQLLLSANAHTANADEAEDYVQETLLRLWRMGDRLDDHPNPEALAQTVLRNIIIDASRKECRRRAYVQDITAESALVESATDAELIGLIVDRLPSSLARAFTLKEIEGYESDEICRIIGCSEVNLRQMLSRARRHIRDTYIRLSSAHR